MLLLFVGCCCCCGGGGCGPGSGAVRSRDWYPGWRRGDLDVEVVKAGQERERRPGGQPGRQRVGGGGAARGGLCNNRQYSQL